MTSRQVAAVAIKILAIWLLVQVVLYLPSIAMLSTSIAEFNGTEIPFVVSGSVFLGMLVVGFAISIMLLRLSNSVLSSTSEIADENCITPVFVLQVSGVFFIVSGITVLPGVVLSIARQSIVEMSSLGYLVGDILKIAVGAYLLIRPNVWVEWFARFRGRG